MSRNQPFFLQTPWRPELFLLACLPMAIFFLGTPIYVILGGEPLPEGAALPLKIGLALPVAWFVNNTTRGRRVTLTVDARQQLHVGHKKLGLFETVEAIDLRAARAAFGPFASMGPQAVVLHLTDGRHRVSVATKQAPYAYPTCAPNVPTVDALFESHEDFERFVALVQQHGVRTDAADVAPEVARRTLRFNAPWVLVPIGMAIFGIVGSMVFALTR